MTTTTFTTNLYDLLDVEPTAGAPEIRAAWRSAVAELDPTDRRFQVFNKAAEVLLDPERRAAYDAELTAETAETTETTGTTGTTVTAETAETTGTAGTAGTAGTVRTGDVEPVSLEKAGDDRGTTAGPRLVPSWLLGGVALLTALVTASAIALWYLTPSDQAIADATAEAEAAAQRATPAVFSYDYEHLDDDHDAAAGLMTADYRKRYDPLFEVVKQNAPALKVSTTATFIASGIVRTGSGRDADDRVQVFVIFDQSTTNKAHSSPVRTPAFATLTMEREGDTWLVDDVEGPPVLD